MSLTSSIKLPETGIESWVKSLAEAHGVTSDPDAISLMALKLSSLSGDDIELDATERLLINLCRKGVLSIDDGLRLISIHLTEKRA